MSLMYDEQTPVTYYDLDCFGRLKLSAFLRMAHIAADINAVSLGAGFNDLAPLGMSFVLQRFGLNIMRLPVYDERVCVRTWPASIEKGVFTRKGDMRDTTGHILMDWISLWVLLDLNTRKILRPSALPHPLPVVADAPSITAEAQKISFSADWGEAFSAYRHTVRYSEVDTNMHMNNTVYGDLIGNVLYLSETTKSDGAWSQVQINYLSETRLGEEIDIVCRKQDHLHKIAGSVNGRPVFYASMESKAE